MTTDELITAICEGKTTLKKERAKQMNKKRNAIWAYLDSNKGQTLHGTFKVGDRVRWSGVAYTLYDHEADGNSSNPVLLSDTYTFHTVKWDGLEQSNTPL